MASFVGRFAGRVAASASVAAVANSAQPPAAARAPVQVAERPVHHPNRKALDEEWLVTEFDKETLLFKPFKVEEIDAAVAEVYAMAGARPHPAVGAPSVVIEEVEGSSRERVSDSGSGSYDSSTSDCLHADLVIEQAAMTASSHSCVSAHSSSSTHPAHPAASGAEGGQAQLGALLHITSRLLQRPGFQREVVACMVEEPEVRDLMLRLDKSQNLDAYLAAVGLHTPGLLPPATAAAVGAATHTSGGAGSACGGDEGDNPVDRLLHAMAAVIDDVHGALQGLGGWLRDRVMALGRQLAVKLGLEEEEEEVDERVDATGSRAPRSPRHAPGQGPLDSVIGAVAVVALGVVCVLLARRPVVLRAL